MRPKWHGKDWREYTCEDCGYNFDSSGQSEVSPRLCDTAYDRNACPDFEHRDVPDPDERNNLDHIKPEDRHGRKD